jgi:flagellar hook-length control protein FliK
MAVPAAPSSAPPGAAAAVPVLPPANTAAAADPSGPDRGLLPEDPPLGAPASPGAPPAATAAPPAAAPAPPQTHTVVQQLAGAGATLADGPVEIRLDPEELGQVRMTLSAGEGTLSLTLTVEREETAALIRRHLDQLAAEFRALGYADLDFRFSDGRAGGEGGHPAPAGSAPSAARDSAGLAPVPDMPIPATSPDGRVDLRL